MAKMSVLQVFQQCIELINIYSVKIEHIAGMDNTSADGLLCLEMLDKVQQNFVNKIFAIDNLDCIKNADFPLSLSLIRSEQTEWDKLQELKRDTNWNLNFGTLCFGDYEVTMIDGPVAVLHILQQCVISWYHESL